ncbi:MAG TPA: acyl dehydratase [Hydrogenophaga sp.]|nr:acyl dehydratase [Hydrogenophaga sp.]HBU18909.1 acyl dehydratase [Hydrogenophaga sp.]
MDTAMTAFLMTSAGQDDANSRPAQPTSALYFEDMEPGICLTSPPHRIDRGELVEFAKVWDPLPFHVDEQAGIQAFGSLTAPGLYMLAVKQRLIHQLPTMKVIASLGYDEVRFVAPLRPDDTVMLRLEWVDRRISGSKPDRGIVTVRFSLINQHAETVMSHLDTILVRLREL